MKLWLTKMGLVAAIGGMAAMAHAQTTQGQTGQAGQTGQTQQQGQQGAAAQPGQAGQAGQGPLSAADERFLRQAYSISQGEVMLGKLAEEHGTTDQVKDFGKRMVGDHSLALQELEEVARQQNLAIPNKLEPAQQNLYDQLSKLHDAAFDQAYLSHMQTGHVQAIKEFEHEAQAGKDQALRGYAQKQLPMLRAHEEIVTHDIKNPPAKTK